MADKQANDINKTTVAVEKPLGNTQSENVFKEEVEKLTKILKAKDQQIEKLRKGQDVKEDYLVGEEKKWLTWLVSNEPFIIKEREIEELSRGYVLEPRELRQAISA